MTTPCEQFHGRMRAICDGTADVPQAVRAAYLKRWGVEDNVDTTAKDHAANRYVRSSMEKVPTAEWTPDMPSRGLGDVIAKVTHKTGIAKAAKAIEKATGIPCGCAERQKRLNAAVPFKGATE